MRCHWQPYDLDYQRTHTCVGSNKYYCSCSCSNNLHFGLPLLLFPGTSIPPRSCIRIRLLFSIHANTTSTNCHCFKHFLRYSSHHRCPSNYFIYNSVQLSPLSMSRHCTALLVLQPSCILLLDPQANSSVTSIGQPPICLPSSIIMTTGY